MFGNANKAYMKSAKFLKKQKDPTSSIDSSSGDICASEQSFLSFKASTSTLSSSTPRPTLTESTKKHNQSVSYAEHQALEALEMLKNTIEGQEIREKVLETKISNNIQEAKNKLQSGSKRGAIRAMKKVKLGQFELDKVSSVIETLEAQVLSIESTLNNIQVLKVMQNGSNMLKNLNSRTKVEDVDLVFDSIQESIDVTAQVNEILSTTYVDNIVMNDDDLLKELENYGINDYESLPLPVAPDHKLPMPSSSSLTQKNEDCRLT